MTLHINDAGTWRQVEAVYVNDAGTWRAIQEIYVNDSGTWRSVFVSDVITISDFDAAAQSSSSNATAIYQIANDGQINATNGNNTLVNIGQWITPQTNMAAYEVRADVTFGSLTSGTTGAWQSCATTRSWTVTRPIALPPGTQGAIMTLQIRRASDAVVMDTATISIEADTTT